MNALVQFSDKRNARRRQLRKATAHEPCLYSFTCSHKSSDDDDVSDNRLRRKGFFTFLDSFVDPMAATNYVICSGPALPTTTAGYFEQVGNYMAYIMYTPEGKLVAGPERRIAKRP